MRKDYLEVMSRLFSSLLNLSLNDRVSSVSREEVVRIAALRAGSQEDFDWMVEQYTPMMHRLACRLMRNRGDASDVVQEAFLKAYRGIAQFHGECTLKTWLYRITLNTASNQNRWWRRHRKQECPMEPAAGAEFTYPEAASDRPSALDGMLTQETQTLVQRGLARLDEAHRTILVLREMEELSYDELGDILHLAPGTVKSRIARARSALRVEIVAIAEHEGSAFPAIDLVK
ncbi:MAG: sigma-70 family RNA polymerase sigma factor [Acidobacteria bacterium]|nr:sigma-70 family RNA polymerase sigma factor [Acidobacteriota bacterium]